MKYVQATLIVLVVVGELAHQLQVVLGAAAVS